MSSDWWTDYRQSRQIRELQREVEATRDRGEKDARRLQSKLTELESAVDQRLDRLTDSFNAFVELSELRRELAAFEQEAQVRSVTRRLLVRLAEGGADLPPLEMDECPGYWLAPAVKALSALARGDEVAADEYAAVASERDEDRTALFLTLALVAAEAHTLAAPWLARALPPLDLTVTRIQRQLWTTCASGLFGEPGRAHVERRLAELVDGLSAETAAAERDSWREAANFAVREEDRPWLPRTLRKVTSLADPPVSAVRLALLRARAEEAVGALDAGEDLTGAALPEDLGSVLNALVDEGSPRERPLIDRAWELRQIIENDAERPEPWDAPAGNTLELLRRDMFESERRALRAVATRAGGRWLRAAAEDLADKASLRPPERVRVRVNDHFAWVGPKGLESRAEVEAEMDAGGVMSPLPEWGGLAVAVLGVTVLVLAVSTGLTSLAIVSGGAAAGGALVCVKRRTDRRRADSAAAREKAALAVEAGRIAEALREHGSRHETLATSAAKDRDAILTIVD
ncbi:hypothetical protein GCM10023196_073780 [Actinoallomurus vinaceus]|uniref:Uncharacterized protein n=1 Tax=Actinoallomurus vinaceus TaxID=1080074 RepID=A0ABP8UKH8_9ACTN